MEQKEKSFVIDIPIYRRDAVVCFGSKDYLAQQIIEAFDKTTEEAYSIIEDITSYSDGRSYLSMEQRVGFIWMRCIPETPNDYSILAHEIFHYTHAIMTVIGASLSEQSEEPYAYLIQFLTKEILEGLNDAHE